jgi:hypothetical protein
MIPLPQEGDAREIVINQETPLVQVKEKTKKLVNQNIVDNEHKEGILIFDNIVVMDEAIWRNIRSKCCSDMVRE